MKYSFHRNKLFGEGGIIAKSVISCEVAGFESAERELTL